MNAGQMRGLVHLTASRVPPPKGSSCVRLMGCSVSEAELSQGPTRKSEPGLGPRTQS